MENSRILIYDGSFNGYLTAINIAFSERLDVVGFQKNDSPQKGLFTNTRTVTTQVDLAKQVWILFERKGNSVIRNIYFAFLSETIHIDFLLYTYMRGLFSSFSDQELELTKDLEQKVMHLAKSVSREKRGLESLVDFNSNNGRIFNAEVSPTYNILPLISRHFRFKYPKHPWIIFDNKRNYGLYYTLTSVELIDQATKNCYLDSNTMVATYAQGDFKYAV